ncbi:hypothetical protein PO124_34410 [Bacillus licheniformis]|nr:hypothetical protein [Bacillus licheniformis]
MNGDSEFASKGRQMSSLKRENSRFTGDGIIISNGGEGYRPSERIQVTNCDIRRSRRNNLSITGCDNVLVEGCEIADAGTGNGTAPCFGIDIEGYSEGSIVYEEPVNVIIRNNVLKAMSIMPFPTSTVLLSSSKAMLQTVPFHTAMERGRRLQTISSRKSRIHRAEHWN